MRTGSGSTTLAITSLLLIGAIGAIGAAFGAEAKVRPPRYDLTILPALQTDAGIFDIIEATELNERGEVAGTARRQLSRGHAAFRYSTRRGMEDLDPDGRYRSRALLLNERGQVFGAVDTGIENPYPYRSHFVADRNGTLDLLENGLAREERKRLRVNFASFNDAGEILTELSPDFLDEDSGELSRAFIYRRESGWQEFTSGEPEFQEANVFTSALTKTGDAILDTGRTNSSGTEEFRNYLYQSDRTVTELPLFAFGLNDSRQIVGADYSRGDAHRSAYYYSAETGTVDLHPEGFAVSSAGFIHNDGTFFLSARKGKPKRNKWSLFLVDSNFDATLIYQWKQVRRFARRSGCRNHKTAEALLQGINLRGDVAGLLLCKGSRNRHFFYSRERGFELMQNLLDEAGRPEVETFQVVGLNEAGQILLNVTTATSRTAALLTPIE